MKISSLKAQTLAFCGLICLLASPAFAQWGSSGGSSGGSYGAYYGSYGSSGGSSGYHRPFTPVRTVLRGIGNHIQAKFERHRARRAYYSSYGSSGHGSSGYGSSGYSVSYGSSGYSTSYGSSGYSVSYGSSGYSTSYGSSGYSTSYGSAGSYDVGYAGGDDFSHVAVTSAAQPADSLSNLSLASSSTYDDAVYLTVNVPASAVVYVNDKQTTSVGSVRQYVSRGLVAGKSYKFNVRAELTTAEGKTVVEEQTVVVRGGAEEALAFNFENVQSNVQTSLTLSVPEGAKVTLAGNTTKAVGQERVFQSSQLKLGESWDDYLVEVEYNGQVKQQSIRLIGGDQLALTFDFENQTHRIAQR